MIFREKLAPIGFINLKKNGFLPKAIVAGATILIKITKEKDMDMLWRN
jgi:hypothetical protein